MIFDAYVIISFLIVLFSYGFVDANLVLSKSTVYQNMQRYVSQVVFGDRVHAAIGYVVVLLVLFLLYVYVLHLVRTQILKKRNLYQIIIITAGILLFAYPAFSHDMFNYMLTSRLTFFYQENPYIVMPIEVPNEPMLAFTRAANKLALYGPTWIVFTYIPYILGQNNYWLTILIYKATNVGLYLLFVRLLYKQTKSLINVSLFALNPLVLIELLVSGHNDLFMMVLAYSGLLLSQQKNIIGKVKGYVLLFLSVFVKFSTIALVPLLFYKKITKEKMFLYASFLMFFVFLLSPIREEMYPWYAVWFMVFVFSLPRKKFHILQNTVIALSLGLVLRQTFYIATGLYTGWTQFARTGITVVFPAVYVLFEGISSIVRWNKA